MGYWWFDTKGSEWFNGVTVFRGITNGQTATASAANFVPAA
jgi:hypothetical protein